jgi:gliding motility-associated-like protein
MYIWFMLKKCSLIFFLLALIDITFGHIDTTKKVIIPHTTPALRFTENLGQWQSHIKMRSGFDGGALFMEQDRLTFNFYDKLKARQFHTKKIEPGSFIDDAINGHAFQIVFEDCNENPSIEKAQMETFYENYFIGSDRSKWKGNVKSYHQVWYKNIYDQIDYEIITSVNGYKYNFHVKPFADPSVIKLNYIGITDIKLKDGALIVKPNVNEVLENKPYAYQIIKGKTIEVPCEFVLTNNQVSYKFKKGYNKNFELIIDPLLVFAAQSGSTADNFGMTATFDSQGNLYSGGTIFNIGYPVTPGAYSGSYNGPVYYGNSDVVISKYNSSGTSMLYSTYLGGGNSETVNSLIIDKNNNLCFYGVTSSTNFPTSAGAFDNTYNGGNFIMYYYNAMRFVNGTDIYVGKLSTNGSSLLACTYLGGSQNDGINQTDTYSPYVVPATPPAVGNITIYQPNYDSLQTNYGDQCRGEIQIDNLNNIYITSSTRSPDFPNVNSFDNTLGGKQDGIIAKFNNNLSSLIYCSFIGGSSTDAGYGLTVKNDFEVYVTGGTTSQNFSITPGAYQSTYQGGNADGYIIRINAAGNQILNSTYFGTPAYDQSFFIQLDKQNRVFIYGQSLGTLPVISDPNSVSIFSVANTHQFIARFSPNLSTLNLSTQFGNYTNFYDISPSAFAIDKCNHIYLSGWGANFLVNGVTLSNMPLSSPTQSTTTGFDFYFMGLDSNAAVLLYGSYFGGGSSQEHVDGGTSRFDPQGRIYQSVCAGCGGNDDFPVTPGAWPNTPGDPNHSSNCNNGVIKLDFQLPLSISTINSNTLQGCVPLTINFTNVTPGASFKWYFGNGQTNTVTLNPSVTYTNPGTYTVSLVVFTPTSCNVKDSSITFITVLPAPTTAFNTTLIPCQNTATFVNNTTGTLAVNPYIWDLGDGTPTTAVNVPPPHTYTANGIYTISLLTTAANGCTVMATRTVSVFDFTPTVSNATLCYGRSVNVTAVGGTSYTWSPGSNLSNSLSASPAANPTTTTIYTIQIDNNSAGFTCSKTLTTQVNVVPSPTAAFTNTMNPCGGGVNFFDQSPPLITSWQWTLFPSVTSTVQNPYNFYSNGGTHTITLVVTNTFGCNDTAKSVISVLVPPPLTINTNSLICLGGKAQLSASGGISYTWSPANSLNNANISNPIATPILSTQYSVVITTSNNCSFLLTTGVGISLPLANTPSAQANPVIVTTGNITTLTYLGPPGSTVVWYPLNSTTPTTGYTVTATPDKPTTYTAVIVTGACSEKTTVYVEAYSEGCIDKDVFVPNTFTPNGDGQNDIFYVRGLKVDQIYFAVYNRWGEMVFETTDKTKGWDGIYKGRPADVDVFGWYLKVKCINGDEAFKKGNVTLVR